MSLCTNLAKCIQELVLGKRVSVHSVEGINVHLQVYQLHLESNGCALNSSYTNKNIWIGKSVLVKVCNKGHIFFNCQLAAPRPTLGHCRGGSLINPMLITAFDS